jgi:hypothetical protein
MKELRVAQAARDALAVAAAADDEVEEAVREDTSAEGHICMSSRPAVISRSIQ